MLQIRRMRRENTARRLEVERQELEAREEAAKTEVKYSQLVAAYMSPNTRDRKNLEDADEADWSQVGGDEKRLTEEEYNSLRDQAQKFYNRNGHARNVIRLIEKYVAGRGLTITPKSTLPEAAEIWKRFWKTNKMNQRAKEIVRRTMRDGEIFIRWFRKGDGYVIRFMNPALIAPPDDIVANKIPGNPSYGIETNHEDIEDVLAYWYKGTRVPADEVQSHKIFADSDEKRGRSYLEVVAQDIAYYAKWRKDRMKLNTVRAAVGLVRKVTGTNTQAENIATNYQTSRRTAPDGSTLMKAPEAVSVLTTKGVDYEMLSPNLQAADVQHDGRAILVAIAAGVGMAEYMVTADASNANYASTMVAEAPGTREFYDWQDFFKDIFEEMYEKVINSAIEWNQLPARETQTESVGEEDPDTGQMVFTDKDVTVDTEVEANIVFPELVHRDIDKETKAYTMQKQNGWMSDRTAQTRLDLDPDAENEQIRKEDQEREERESFTELVPEDEEFEKEREKEMQTAPVAKEKGEATKESIIYEEATGIAKVAKDAVKAALASGKIKKPSDCTKCGKQKPLVGHHSDYSKPLAVVWLCRDCHPPVAKAVAGGNGQKK